MHDKLCIKKIILFTSPLVLWLLCQLLPTFDDWTYYTAPYMGSLFSSRWLPIDSWWRPFDHVFGWIVGLNYKLFPTLNHVFVYAAHLMNTLLVSRIARQLQFSPYGQTIATLFFYLSPAMLGTVTGIDSLNQAYSHFWGLLAMTIYLASHNSGEWRVESGERKDSCAENKSAGKTILSPHSPSTPLRVIRVIRGSTPPLLWGAILIATLCKENGYMWGFIIPLVAWGFQLIDRRKLLRDWALVIALGIAYFVVRLLLTTSQVDINNEYFDVTLANRLKDIATFIGLTWIPIDYVALFNLTNHQSQLSSILLLGLTLLAGMPFMLYTYFRRPRNLIDRRHLVLFAGIILAALPHLATLFTAMHAYAGLSMAALSIAWLNEAPNNKGEWKGRERGVKGERGYHEFHEFLETGERKDSCAENKSAGKTILSPLSTLHSPLLFLAGILAVDIHHGIAAYQSGQVGKQMAVQAIAKTGSPVDKVSIIYINTGEKRYSSFCCIPYDAFSWGNTVIYETGYQWPNDFEYHEISSGPDEHRQALDLARKDIDNNNCQCAWIVRKDQIEVIR